VNHSRKPIFEKLQTLAFPVTAGNQLFAFVHHKAVVSAKGQDSVRSPGWQVYNFESEMARQGVPNEAWKICRLNQDYNFAPSYPALFAAPASLSDEDITKVCETTLQYTIPAVHLLLVCVIF
jgi:myotubularin-related protein 1/2